MKRHRPTHANAPPIKQLTELGRVALHAVETRDPAVMREAAALAIKFGLIHVGERVELLAAVVAARIGEIGDEALEDVARRSRQELARRQTRRGTRLLLGVAPESEGISNA